MVELPYSIIHINATVSSKILSLLTKLEGGRGGGGVHAPQGNRIVLKRSKYPLIDPFLL